jgi:predicted membrane channel-forming protein YqfA (hemolysin III family)
MLSSSAFHLYLPLGRKQYSRLLRLDLIGIGIMIFGLTLSVTFVAMHNYEKVRHIALSLLISLMVSNLVIQLTPCYGKDSFHFNRVIIFVVMILLCLALTMFLRVKIASTQEIDGLYGRIFSAMLSLAIGFFFYVTHVPERYLTSCFGKKKSSRWIRERI